MLQPSDAVIIEYCISLDIQINFIISTQDFGNNINKTIIYILKVEYLTFNVVMIHFSFILINLTNMSLPINIMIEYTYIG